MARSVDARLALKLVGMAVAMFLFAMFIMPPLYDAFCDITGLGGKTGGQYEFQVEEAGVDYSRTGKVIFTATQNAETPWAFEPSSHEISVHPGEPTLVTYRAKNITGKDMVAQAIPSLAPNNAARYFNKTECFCFERQPLEAGAEAELPLVFIVDRDLPRSVNTVILSYTIFDVTNRDSERVALLN